MQPQKRGSVTHVPCAVFEFGLLNSSMTGVWAAAMASPFLDERSEGMPQPSMTTKTAL